MAFDPARVKSLFLEASDLASPEERAAYLDRECDGEPDLRARVEALLVVEKRAGPVPEVEATGAIQLTSAEALQATQMLASETLSGSRVSDPEDGLATVGATGIGEADTLAEGPSVARSGGFVPGQVIGGRYTLLEVLGEGGMGTVYKAEQSQPVKRQVALKLIKIGMDSRSVLARFDAERQALAMMDHPNIARVYDGGATDANQPFFVMEFVDGVPITDYCDQHRLSVDARLQLFVAVCQAVQHAHQKGIIHRDLKPSNVMVTEVDGRPTPKVIDFGVAKATEATLTDQTLGDTGAIVGTPTYMSPEQADPSTQDIDTRTDVYALGVILYELLAGSPPLDATQFKRGAILEMLRMVREVDPSKPSTKVSTADALPNIAANRGIDPSQLKRELRGDLDWIVMKALEKDRTRRYETANGFGADILRHLASEPVQAAPPSRSYRLRKFVRKHRSGVIAASLVLLALLAGVMGTTWGLIEARRQEARANERAEGERLATLKALKAAEGERLAKLDAQEKKSLAESNEKKALAAAEEEKKAKETAEDVLGFVETKVFTAARPRDRGGLGYDVKLVDAITAALPSIGKDFADKPLTEARLHMWTGATFLDLGRPEIAVEQYEAARSIHRRVLGPDHLDTLASMNNLAYSYGQLGRHAEALKLQEETLALAKAKLGPDHDYTLASMQNLAGSYDSLGRRAEALKLREEGLALMKAKLGPDNTWTLTSMLNLALSYGDLGRHAEALKLQEETLAIRKARLGTDHPDTVASMIAVASSYARLGKHAQAVELYEKSLAFQKARLGPDHPTTLKIMNLLAGDYDAIKRHAEALRLGEETLRLQRARLGQDHPDTLVSMGNLAKIYEENGRHAEALKLFEETVALEKAKLGPDHPLTLTSMGNLAGSYAAAGRQAEALKLREETLALEKAKLGPDHPGTLMSMNNLSVSYTDLGRHAEALKLWEEILPIQKKRLGPNHPDTLLTMRNLAFSYDKADRHAEALKLREEILAIRKATFGPDDPATIRCMSDLANAYIANGRTREALPLLAESSAADPKDTFLWMKSASLQVWFGQDEDFAVSRRRVLAAARGVEVANAPERAAKVSSLLPSADIAELDAAIALGRHAVDLGKGDNYLDFYLMSLGMAEYRGGHFAEAETSLAAAMDRPHPGDRFKYIVEGTSAFYRAMSLFRQGKKDEARMLATEAAAKMKPLPTDQENPLANGADHDDLILWLAYREAKALIGFDPPPAPTAPVAK